MEKLFPKELSALIKKTPEVESISWTQYSEGGFSMDPYEVELAPNIKKFNHKEFRKEVDRLMSPMPSSLLLQMYEHHAQVVATEGGITSSYDEDGDLYDSGAGGASRKTPGKVELTDSPLGECFKEYYDLRAQACSSVEKLVMAFVEKHKEEIKSLQWTQYTPGFCDGETCDFSVYDP